jgi:nucleoid DNA-binding protein
MEHQSSTAAKPMNKTELTNALITATGLTKAQVNTFFEELTKIMSQQLGDGGPGEFTLPSLAKIKVVRKPATPERMGIDPFTKQEKLFKAKPARKVVKVNALKGLKDLV